MITQRQSTSGLVGGAILIALGLLFLMGQFFNFQGWGNLWPLFIVGVGLVFFAGMVAGGKSTAGLAIPGAIITAIGLMMFFQNLTDHWESWAYGWTVIIMAVGAGIAIAGAWSGSASQRQAGLRLAGIGFVLFAVFGSFFELMLFGGGSRWGQIGLPILLILAGGYLVVRRSGLWPNQPKPELPSEPRPVPPQG